VTRSGQPASSDIETAYRGVPALVLGASGFIGSWTARALHGRGANVIVSARNGQRVREAFAPFGWCPRIEVADLTEPGAVTRLVRTTQPAIVFNLAGYGVDRSERDPVLMAQLNARLVAELCEALAVPSEVSWMGVRLVHTGSAAEYGPVEGTIVETSPERPIGEYGRTKLEGTRLLQRSCLVSGLNAVVARLFTVYGPGDYPSKIVNALMRAAKTGEPLELTGGRQRRNFTYIGDVAEGLLRLGLSVPNRGEIVHLAGAFVVSVREFAETAAAVLGLDRALLQFDALADRDDEMWHGDVDCARLQALISWAPPTGIREGIRRSWEFENG
jgi:nucleoside-diphosphate-sugar epimerase